MSAPQLSDLDLALSRLPWSEIKRMAIHLHHTMTLPVLDQVEEDRSKTAERRIYCMDLWLKSDTDASWMKVVIALKNIDQNHLAKLVESSYCACLPAPMRDTRAPSQPFQTRTADPLPTTVDPVRLPAPCRVDQELGEPAALEDYSRVDEVQRVVEGSSELEQRFFSVVTHVQVYFCDKETESNKFLGNFRITLINLPLSRKFKHMHFLKEKKVLIKGAQDVSEIFEILSPYWNHVDYDLLEHIVLEFGEKEIKLEVERYISDLIEFEKGTSIQSYVEATSGDRKIPPEFCEIIIKLDRKPSECTLYDIRRFKESVACRSSLSAYSVYLKNVGTGSVEITLAVPDDAVDVFVKAVRDLQLEKDTHIISVYVKDKAVQCDAATYLSASTTIGAVGVRSPATMLARPRSPPPYRPPPPYLPPRTEHGGEASGNDALEHLPSFQRPTSLGTEGLQSGIFDTPKTSSQSNEYCVPSLPTVPKNLQQVPFTLSCQNTSGYPHYHTTSCLDNRLRDGGRRILQQHHSASMDLTPRVEQQESCTPTQGVTTPYRAKDLLCDPILSSALISVARGESMLSLLSSGAESGYYSSSSQWSLCSELYEEVQRMAKRVAEPDAGPSEGTQISGEILLMAVGRLPQWQNEQFHAGDTPELCRQIAVPNGSRNHSLDPLEPIYNVSLNSGRSGESALSDSDSLSCPPSPAVSSIHEEDVSTSDSPYQPRPIISIDDERFGQYPDHHYFQQQVNQDQFLEQSRKYAPSQASSLGTQNIFEGYPETGYGSQYDTHPAYHHSSCDPLSSLGVPLKEPRLGSTSSVHSDKTHSTRHSKGNIKSGKSSHSGRLDVEHEHLSQRMSPHHYDEHYRRHSPSSHHSDRYSDRYSDRHSDHHGDHHSDRHSDHHIIDEVLLIAISCLMHQENCQVHKCPCKQVKKRFHNILPQTRLHMQKEADKVVEDARSGNFDPSDRRQQMRISLSSQNFSKDIHAHYHLTSRSHIRPSDGRQRILQRRRSRSVDLTPVVEQPESCATTPGVVIPDGARGLLCGPVFSPAVTPAGEKFKVLSPTVPAMNTVIPPVLLREISMSADNLPSLCLNDSPPKIPAKQKNFALEQLKHLVPVANSNKRAQRSGSTSSHSSHASHLSIASVGSHVSHASDGSITTQTLC